MSAEHCGAITLSPSPHIRLADIQGDLVILDLAQDDYLCVAACDAVPVWSALRGEHHDVSDPFVADLVVAGFLRASPISAPWVRALPSDISDVPAGAHFRIQMSDVFHVTLAAVQTWWALRSGTTARLMEGAMPRSKKCLLSDEEVFNLSARFAWLRCLVPYGGRCLVQSAMLRNVLTRHAVPHDWVFGVQTHPFEAHCWIEACGAVLNDSVEHISWYTVIARF